MSMQGWQALHSLSRDASVKERRLTPGTTRRVLGYARPYKTAIAWFLGLVVVESVLVVATPLLLKSLIDDGIVPKDSGVVVRLSLVVAGLGLVATTTTPPAPAKIVATTWRVAPSTCSQLSSTRMPPRWAMTTMAASSDSNPSASTTTSGPDPGGTVASPRHHGSVIT